MRLIVVWCKRYMRSSLISVVGKNCLLVFGKPFAVLATVNLWILIYRWIMLRLFSLSYFTAFSREETKPQILNGSWFELYVTWKNTNCFRVVKPQFLQSSCTMLLVLVSSHILYPFPFLCAFFYLPSFIFAIFSSSFYFVSIYFNYDRLPVISFIFLIFIFKPNFLFLFSFLLWRRVVSVLCCFSSNDDVTSKGRKSDGT